MQQQNLAETLAPRVRRAGDELDLEAGGRLVEDVPEDWEKKLLLASRILKAVYQMCGTAELDDAQTHCAMICYPGGINPGRRLRRAADGPLAENAINSRQEP